MKIVIDLTTYMPPTIYLFGTFIFLLVFSAVVVVYSGGARLILGKNTAFNHAISSAIGVMMVYALIGTLGSLFPGKFFDKEFVLPFATFTNESVNLLTFHGENMDVHTICLHVLWMLVFSYIVNLFDDRLPEGTTLLGWFTFRIVGIFLGFGVYLLVIKFLNWGYGKIPEGYIPQTVLDYLPVVLTFALSFMILLGLFKLVLIALMFRVNPLFGGLYTFFFDHKDGKPITRAVFTTQILLVVLWVFEKLGFQVIELKASSLDGFIPFTIWMGLTWFVMGLFI